MTYVDCFSIQTKFCLIMHGRFTRHRQQIWQPFRLLSNSYHTTRHNTNSSCLKINFYCCGPRGLNPVNKGLSFEHSLVRTQYSRCLYVIQMLNFQLQKTMPSIRRRYMVNVAISKIRLWWQENDFLALARLK